MILRKDLEIAVRELENSQPTYQTCSKLADLYIILDHLGEGYSESKRESEFLKAAKGKDIGAIMDLMDELMETTHILNPRVYDAVIMRLNEL